MQRTRILTLTDKGVPNRYPLAYSLKYSRNIRADRTNRSPRSERFVHPLEIRESENTTALTEDRIPIWECVMPIS